MLLLYGIPIFNFSAPPFEFTEDRHCFLLSCSDFWAGDTERERQPISLPLSRHQGLSNLVQPHHSNNALSLTCSNSGSQQAWLRQEGRGGCGAQLPRGEKGEGYTDTGKHPTMLRHTHAHTQQVQQETNYALT